MIGKKELVDRICKHNRLERLAANHAVNVVLNEIHRALLDGEEIRLVGFGTFSKETRAERKGRNPQTGEEITIPACKVVKFKPSKNLGKE